MNYIDNVTNQSCAVLALDIANYISSIAAAPFVKNRLHNQHLTLPPDLVVVY